MAIVNVTAHDGTVVSFVDERKASGGLKDCYFSPDGSYAVLFYREPLSASDKDRVKVIAGRYRESVFNQEGGSYWSGVYCWPQRTLEWNGMFGITAPMYGRQFFFEHGSKNGDMLNIKGREKEGKWFASANNRSKFLDPRELGTWATHLRVCLLIARAVRRLHMAGLAHSDLSYKNVLVDPAGGNACIIDIDGLVVPGKFPPAVVGTPDFIAPEVVATNGLGRDDPRRKLPNIQTDLHALAVLMYMYLLYRHPLRGGKIHHEDSAKDEEMMMGERAMFVEDPQDQSNRIKLASVRPSELPWADTRLRPYTLTGPYLAPLFLQAFTAGLGSPQSRPGAGEWEAALIRTVDLLQPCANAACEQKWYVFDNSAKPKCPFCGTSYKGLLPVLNLYYPTHRAGEFRDENRRLMIYKGLSLYPWHVYRQIAPNERLTDAQKRRVGYFQLHQNRWLLVNESLPDLFNESGRVPVLIGQSVELKEGLQLRLSKGEGGRLVHVQMVDAR
jgi:serine/threonine protein kinase